MHDFYKRIQTVFRRAGSNRNRFCKKYGYNYQTLQAYWNTHKLPPGNVLADLAREFNISLDALVLGRSFQDVHFENPILTRIAHFLIQQDDESLIRIEGALMMFKYLNLSGLSSPSHIDSAIRVSLANKYSDNNLEIMPAKTEIVMNLIADLSRHLRKVNMSDEEKTISRKIVGQIVQNIYQRELKDEWASLEELEEEEGEQSESPSGTAK